MRFACFRDGLRAETVLGADERKDIAEFGRVEHHRRAEPGRASVLEVNGRNGDDAIVRRLGGRHFRSQMQRDAASVDVRLKERHHGRHGDLWLEGDARHPAVAGIEMRPPTGLARMGR